MRVFNSTVPILFEFRCRRVIPLPARRAASLPACSVSLQRVFQHQAGSARAAPCRRSVFPVSPTHGLAVHREARSWEHHRQAPRRNSRCCSAVRPRWRRSWHVLSLDR